MRKTVTILLLLLVVIGGGLGYFYRERILKFMQSHSYSPQKEREDQTRAEQLLKDGNEEAAWEIIEAYEDRLGDGDEVAQKWVELYVKGAVATQSPEKVIALFEKYPKTAEKNEEVALTVADVLIKTGRTRDYGTLREKWKDREGKPEIWFILDADQQLIDGDRTAAVKFLNSRSFEGTADVPRLVRLAILNVEQNPRLAWEYLTEAYQKDPQNPDVRTYRARLLEAVGKTPLALTEYLSAAQLAPNSLVMRDQLAEFYRRQGRYKLALKVWEDSLEKPHANPIWVKLWFWSRVATPADSKWQDKSVPAGELKPFVQYLLALKPNQFWNAASFEAIPDGNRYLQGQQSTFWLRLLQELKDGKEDKAWEMLQYNHFHPMSWSPELETTLKRILNYRRSGTLVLPDVLASKGTTPVAQPKQGSSTDTTNLGSNVQKHPFLVELETYSAPDNASNLPENLVALLKGKDAFAAAFLANGWLQAALDLSSGGVLPSDAPDWLAYGFTQAYRYNKGNMPALEYATKQKPTPALNLLIGELLIANGSPDAGMEKLTPLVDDTTDVGFRAAWLVSLLQLERGQYDQAKAMITSHPRLAQDLLGKEALARIALMQGDTALADKLYGAIESQSWEAKSYLARKAYEDKNYPKAKELTELLLQEFPNNVLLRQNYQKIIEESGQPDQQKAPIVKDPTTKAKNQK